MLCFLLPLLFLATITKATDPDLYLTTPQLIRRHGYPVESHIIETNDGYLLTLHRIPPKDRLVQPAVFLQHGLLSSSADWVLLGPGKALPYILADNGFDVWLGNIRGSTYSKAHVNLSPKDLKFWDFSWDEMALIDLPAMLNYVLYTTNQKTISYIGHSMGTTMFFALTSSVPRYDKMISVMIALAPVAFVNNTQSPIRKAAPFANDIEWITNHLGKGEFIPENNFFSYIANKICNLVLIDTVCRSVLFEIVGYDSEQFDKHMLSLILTHATGTSVKTLLHYVQELKTGNFCKFDFGEMGNEQAYNSTTPPNYNISAITVPIALFYGNNDLLVSLKDLRHLAKLLPNKIGDYLIQYDGFNHVDFLWAKDAPKLVYNTVLNVLKKIA